MSTLIILLVISVLFVGLSFSNQERSIRKSLLYWLTFCILGSVYPATYFVRSWNNNLPSGFTSMRIFDGIFIVFVLTFLCFAVSLPLILLLKLTLKKSQSTLINSLVILGYFVLVDIIIRNFFNKYWNLQNTLEVVLPYFIIALLLFLVWLKQYKKEHLS